MRRLVGRSAPAWWMAMAIAGCGHSSESPPPSSAPSANANGGVSATPPPPEPESAALAPIEVHEWGLVDIPRMGPAEIGTGPGRPVPMSVRKPVLYVHADPGAPPITIDVRVDMPHGEVLEVWPTSSEWPSTHVEPTSILWRGLTVSGCEGAPTRGPLAAREATGCATADGYCEVNDLPGYVTSDASCLVANGTSASLLFYRGRATTVAVPLQIVSAESVMSHTTGGSPILRFRSGHGSETPWPIPGPPATLAPDTLDGDALAHRLHVLLMEAGLTSPEADAFLRAWSESMFGVPWGAVRDAPSPSARRGRALAADPPVAIYILPETLVAPIAELTITPTPRVVRRVMVVRVELPG
ncbi:MAG: hypothetical protein U0353_22945 [Sandaracinus sp.]